jgi:hypothetical protein
MRRCLTGVSGRNFGRAILGKDNGTVNAMPAEVAASGYVLRHKRGEGAMLYPVVLPAQEEQLQVRMLPGSVGTSD